MAVSYTWEFPQFEKALLEGDLCDVVKVIHWRLIAKDGDYTASAYGTASVAAPNPDNFTAYDELTKQWAIDAVSAIVDVPAMEATLDADIARQKSPPIVAAAPPFPND